MLFGESENWGFWSKNGTGTELECRAVREDEKHSNGSTVFFLSLCLGLMLPGGYRAALCAKQEENNTEMDQPNRTKWT